MQWAHRLPKPWCLFSSCSWHALLTKADRWLLSIQSSGPFRRVLAWTALKAKHDNGSSAALKKKWSHFDLKSWVTDRTKIRHGIPRNWRIFVSKLIDIESKFDSNILQLLGIPCRILGPPVTQLFEVKMTPLFLSVPLCSKKLTHSKNFFPCLRTCYKMLH